MAQFYNGSYRQVQKDDAAVIINANLCNITLYPPQRRAKTTKIQIANWEYFVAQPAKNEFFLEIA
jgi:hypothetical protein